MKARILWVLLLGLSVAAFAANYEHNWPQWHGPDRTGKSAETGLLKQWPASGPPVVWSIANLGSGYGSVAIADDRIYVQGAQGGQSLVFSLGRENGKVVWSRALGRSLEQDRGGGPRGTPTVDGDRVYALSEAGDLACLRVRDGSVVWQRNILNDFRGRNIRWHLSESPLVDGSRLIVTPGGPGAGIAALDKMTGATVWTARELNDAAGYSSCIVQNVHGVRTIMTLTASAGVGVRAADGKLMWRYTQVANRTANITTPVFHDNKVFYTSAYGTGGALLKLLPQGDSVRAEEAYFSRDMMNHHGGVVLVNGHIYGFHNAILTCIDFETGNAVWRDRSVGKGSVTYADGHLYLLGENQTVGLAEATPDGYREKGRFKIADRGWPSWAHPVVCGGRLYIRNQGDLTVYNVRR